MSLKKLFGNAFQIDRVINLLASAETMAALEDTSDPATLPALWKKPLDEFKAARRNYLIYR